MPNTIQTVPLSPAAGPQAVAAPAGASVLGVRQSGDTPQLALLADGTRETVTKHVQAFLVGETPPPDARYLGHTQEAPGRPVRYWFIVRGDV